jgi:hypothetical protein
MSPVRQKPKGARSRKVSYIKTKKKQKRNKILWQAATGGNSSDDSDKLPTPNPRGAWLES